MKRRLRLYRRLVDITLYGVCGTLGLGLISAVGGCSNNKIIGNQNDDPTTIQIGDFRGNPDATTDQASSQTAQIINDQAAQNQPDDNASTADPETPVLVSGTKGDTPRAAIRSGEDGLEFLDAKIGDISGHPIYVSSFFDPIEDRLVALGQRADLNTWRSQAIEIVKGRLDGIIYDELLRAETIAALTPQQRVGLQSFLKDFRSNILSNNLGSAQLADRRIQAEQGVSLDEALRQKELDTLVGLTLYQEINRGINISWRDIKQRYEQDINRFQPPPTVVLQAIRVLEPEGELVDSITSRLNAGESFPDIAASDINTFFTDTQGKIEKILEDDFDKTSFFFQLKALNETVWTLSEGEWAGPVRVGNGNYWVLYAERKQETVSLYEAQIQLLRELTQERRETERAKYLEELIERARVSSRNEILLRLLYIAEQQYGPLG